VRFRGLLTHTGGDPTVPVVARVLRPALWVTMVGLAITAAGLVVLFVQARSEVMADPALSLEDGYWIGRLPWTEVGVDLTVIGATVVLVFGAATAWLAGGPIRRVVSALALAIGLVWWLLMMLPPPQAVPCPSCPPRGPEPLTMAYSQPGFAVQFLLLPAAIAAAVAFSAVRLRASVGEGAAGD